MPKFRYKAINSSNQSYEDEVEAPDKYAVYKQIRSQGETVIYAHEVRSKVLFSFERFAHMFSRVKTHEKIIFARNLSSMVQAGLSVTRALAVMEKQTKNRKLQLVLVQLGEDVSKGMSLSDSMKSLPDVFPTLFTAMVHAGEESGNLADSLKVVSLQMEKSYSLARKVRGALIYPAVIISIMIIIGVLMLVYMVPTLTSTFEGLGVELPMSTRMIIWVSDFLRTQYLLVAVAAAGLVTGASFFFKSPMGKKIFYYVSLRIPLIGTIVKEVNSARMARTMASLLSSGVDVVVAISVTRDVVQNYFYKTVLAKAEENIQKGEAISDVFIKNEDLYPIFVGEMVSVGEETGRMSEMFLEIATFYEEEVDQKTKNMSTIIEPFLMVFMGVAVGFFAIAMLAPTYSLVDAI